MATKPNPVDVHVGQRVRLRRKLMRMSQGTLSDALGVTFQQVQKYERGANRIAASRLYQLTNILDVPISYFFDDLPDEYKGTPIGHEVDLSGGECTERGDMARSETLELVRAFYRIPEIRLRRKVYELIRASSQIGSGKDA